MVGKLWTKLFGTRDKRRPEQDARVRAEERLDRQRRDVIDQYRRFGK